MLLRQITDSHLSQYSYLIGCQQTGEAIVIDPERDIDRYYAIAKQEDLRITYVAETHIHADFLSGVSEFVAHDPSIQIYLSAEGGPNWQSEWAVGLKDVHLLQDGSTFKVGNIEFQAIHTPGHTPEHMVFLVTDLGGGADEPMMLLSGDCIFVNDVGRPDLLEQAAGIKGTQETSASDLYSSLRKLSSLPSYLQIFPGHGAGSACGKALGAMPSTTLGYEKKFNPSLKLALNAIEDDFVKFIISDQPEPPAYFGTMKRLNKVGPAILNQLPPVHEISAEEILSHIEKEDITILDTRSKQAFLKEHMRNSLFTPAVAFSAFVGAYVSPKDKIILVTEDSTLVEEYVRQLIRIGFDHIFGFLTPSAIELVPTAIRTSIRSVKFKDVPSLLNEDPKMITLDVRTSHEYAQGHLEKAENIAYTRLLPRLEDLCGQKLLVHCASGVRAIGACAFLNRNGHDVICIDDKFKNAPKELLTK